MAHGGNVFQRRLMLLPAQEPASLISAELVQEAGATPKLDAHAAHRNEAIWTHLVRAMPSGQKHGELDG